MDNFSGTDLISRGHGIILRHTSSLLINHKHTLFKFLQGYRTYIMVGIGAVVWIAYTLGYIPADMELQILTLLGLGSFAGIRAAVR